MEMRIRIEPRQEQHLAEVRALLEAEDVSTEGLEQSAGFIVVDGEAEQARVVGHLAIIPLGQGYATLTHLVLAEPYRGRGWTNGLACHVEGWARDRGLEELLVFTNRKTAIRWLADRGFTEVDPPKLPEPARAWSLFGTPVIQGSHAFERPVIQGVLFLGETNSGRTLIAEALARRMAPETIPVYSAGITEATIEPLAPRALREINVDPTGLRPKLLDSIPIEEVNLVFSFGHSFKNRFLASQPLAHEVIWELPDVETGAGDENARLIPYREAVETLERRLSRFFA